jgi:hypothetical protein
MLDKKPYEAPVVKEVRLEIKNAVLATCNTSFDATPRPGSPLQGPCYLNPDCRT